MHSGVHVTRRTAALRMNRQSLAVGFAPLEIGCEHGRTGGTVVVVVLVVVVAAHVPPG